VAVNGRNGLVVSESSEFHKESRPVVSVCLVRLEWCVGFPVGFFVTESNKGLV